MQERLFSRELNRLRARSPGFASGFPSTTDSPQSRSAASAAAPAQAPNSQPRLVSQPSPFPGLREPALRSIRGVKPKAPGEEMLSHPVAGVAHSNHAASPYLKLKPFASAGEVPGNDIRKRLPALLRECRWRDPQWVSSSAPVREHRLLSCNLLPPKPYPGRHGKCDENDEATE